MIWALFFNLFIFPPLTLWFFSCVIFVCLFCTSFLLPCVFVFVFLSLQCSPLLKARRPIQKTGSAWRCVVSISACCSRTKRPLSILRSLVFSQVELIFPIFSPQTPKRVEVHSIHTYVALYKFLPQEKNDLELQLVKLLWIICFLCAFFFSFCVWIRGARWERTSLHHLAPQQDHRWWGSNWKAGGDHAGRMGRTNRCTECVSVKSFLYVSRYNQLLSVV